MNNQSKTFCLHPFTGLATSTDGSILVCCRSHPIGNIKDNSLEEIWNNDKMREIRRKVLNGEWPSECASCKLDEDSGVESMRLRHISGRIPETRSLLYPNALDELDDDHKMPFKIPSMEIKLNNLCNLKCRMCHPMDSTSWNDWDQVEEFYKKEGNFMINFIEKNNLKRKPYLNFYEDNPNWWNSFEKNIPYFDRVEFAGGEPLMDPEHYKILSMLKPYGKNITLKYATNGTTLGIKSGNIYDYWPNFKSVMVSISMDGIGDVYNYIRGNSEWQLVLDNIKRIQMMPNIKRIVCSAAVQVGNVMKIDQMIEFLLNDLGVVYWNNFVNHPNLLSAQVLPEPLKKIAAERLMDMRDKVPGFKMVQQYPILKDLTIKQINGIISYMYAKDLSHMWKDCVEFNHRLDTSRNQKKFEEVNEDFLPYV